MDYRRPEGHTFRVVAKSIDPDGPDPLYLQLADLLEERIRDGELAVNRPVPSAATLQQQYGVARGTALRATGLLVERGLVRIVPGRGAYVRPREDWPNR
jgi:DNA-binding GntR family transcriptional regulator